MQMNRVESNSQWYCVVSPRQTGKPAAIVYVEDLQAGEAG